MSSDEEYDRWTRDKSAWSGYRIARTVWDLVEHYGEDIGVAWDRDMSELPLPDDPPARVLPRAVVSLNQNAPSAVYYQAGLVVSDTPTLSHAEALYDPRQRRWIRPSVVIQVSAKGVPTSVLARHFLPSKGGV